MAARVVDPALVAATFREEVRTELSTLPGPLKLVGFLAEGHGPSATYAGYTRQGCEQVGMEFELRSVRREDAESAVRAAGADPSVHGILVYYPIGGAEPDGWLRELVDPRKDIEGLHSFWCRNLYENRRFVDSAHTKRAILPCTPLAIMKLVEHAGACTPGAENPVAGSRASTKRPLEGVRAAVFNRSEVVGYPLAAMLANDGAEVVSWDVAGPLLFQPGDARYEVHATRLTRAESLARADLVITGVPHRDFQRVKAAELKPGAICINFSTFKNFEEDVIDRASVFIPRVGPMTVTMALRNTLRLYRNTHA